MTDAQSRTPVVEGPAFDCPRCGVYAKQNWTKLFVAPQTLAIDSKSILITTEDGDIVKPKNVQVGFWRMAKCTACNEGSVWRDDRMIYPAAATVPVPHVDMPEEAKELYEEARNVVGISRRAGAALARASLERLLRTLDPEADSIKKIDLMKRIDRIVDRVSSSLGDMLTVIRHAGNKSLHVEDETDDLLVLVLDPEDEEIVELIFDSINDLVDELITRPARAKKVYGKVPDRIRKEVESVRTRRATAEAKDEPETP